MPAKYTYLLVNLLCLLFPLIASFHRRIKFYRQWKYFIIPCLLTALFFLVWDGIFTHIGVWGFNEKYVVGIYVYNMPLEELLFFICIPYACTFTYHCIKRFVRFEKDEKMLRIFNYLLSVVFLLFALLIYDKWYTFTTFLLLAIFLFIANQKSFVKWKAFYTCFLLILIPFLVSNGILTGSFIENPVVVYNNNENLGIRILTIPVEDAFYALLLIGMNVYGFEWMRSRQHHQQG